MPGKNLNAGTGASGKKRLFIHAGTYKTGTSHFQHVMFENREKMLEEGFYYPVTGLGLNTPHNKYAHRLAAINLAQHGKNAFPKIVENLVKDERLHTAYMSYEGFAHPNNIEHIAKIMDCFEPVELHTILVFRPHFDFQISLYREICQHVKYSENIETYLQSSNGWGRTFHYADSIKMWENLIGPDNLHVMSYSTIKKDLFHALLTPTGYQPDLKEPAETTSNPTISAPACAVARRLNKFNLKTHLRHRVGRALVRLDAKNPHFHEYGEITREAALEIEQNFQEDRERLATYGLDPNDFVIGENWRWGKKQLNQKIVDEAFVKFICLLKNEKRNVILNAITA
ncbi:MAG: hypothetical protein HWE08_03155 [Alphaproteobacteria bacterium]|nr:hypothetical protein [Alphaproteobacteria bacterium]